MKSKVKMGLSFLGGVIFGGGVSFGVTYKLTTKKWMQISDDRVKSMEDYYIKRINSLEKKLSIKELGYDTESDADDISEDSAESSESDLNQGAGYKNSELDSRMVSNIKRQNEATYVRYSRLSGSDEYESAVEDRFDAIAATLEHPHDSDEDEVDNEDEEWSQKANSASPPMVIDESEFGSTGYLDEVVLLYYPDDDTLTTEDGQIISDQGLLVGNLIEETRFNENTVHDLYVRNYRRSTEYRISKVWGPCPESEEY